MKIPIDKIDCDNYRAHINTVDLQASIKQVGMIEPITVRLGDGDRYVLLSGHGRLAAMRALGETEIEANVLGTDNKPMDDLLIKIAANVRHSVNPYDLAVGLKRLLDSGTNPMRVAQAAGMTIDDVHLHLRLLSADEKVREAIRTGRLTVSAFRFISNMDAPSQEQVMDKARSRKADGRVTVDNVRTAVASVSKERYVARMIDDPRTANQKLNDALRLVRDVINAAPYDAAATAAIGFNLNAIKEELDRWGK